MVLAIYALIVALTESIDDYYALCTVSQQIGNKQLKLILTIFSY